jgi:predicted nucleic acid-binding protein
VSERPWVVMDASAAMKLFCDEPGHAAVRAVWNEHVEGRVVIAIDHLCIYEVLGVVKRKLDSERARRAFTVLTESGLSLASPGAPLVAAAFDQCDELGCDLYDGFSAGLASLLDARLYSADRKAHATFPGVVLVDIDPPPATGAPAPIGAPATPR